MVSFRISGRKLSTRMFLHPMPRIGNFSNSIFLTYGLWGVHTATTWWLSYLGGKFIRATAATWQNGRGRFPAPAHLCGPLVLSRHHAGWGEFDSPLGEAFMIPMVFLFDPDDIR